MNKSRYDFGDFDYEEVISMVNEYLIVGTVINTHGVKGAEG